MRRSPPETSPQTKRRAITRYWVLAIGLHALILGIPLQPHLSGAEMPAQPTLLASLQPQRVAPAIQPASSSTSEKREKELPAKPRPIRKPVARAVATPPVTSPAQESTAPKQANTSPAEAVPTSILNTPPQPIQQASTPRFDVAYLNNPRPNYPPQSRRLNETGKVLLKVRVSTEGHTVAVDIAQSSNSVRLDEAARQAVSQWRFIPAKLGDQPIAADVIVPIVFKLDN